MEENKWEPEWQENEEENGFRTKRTSDTDLDENAPIADFGKFSDAALTALTTEIFGDMTLSDLRFCRDWYRQEQKTVTYGELGMLEALIAARRRSARNRAITRVCIRDRSLAQTYEDLLQKRRVLTSDLPPFLRLSEAADLAPRYMEMIGRGGERRHSAGSELPCLPSGTAFVLLTSCDGADRQIYEKRVGALLEDREISSWYRGWCRVDQYGILGTLAERCQGVFADTERLPQTGEKAFSLRDLVLSYQGCLIVYTTKDGAMWLNRYAERYSLQATYFAKATETGRWRTSRDHTPHTDIKISFLRALMHATDPSEAVLPTETMQYDASRIMQGENLPVPNVARYAVTRAAWAEENCFSHAVNSVLDAVIALVSQGVDRRAVGLSLSYELPEYAADAEEMGKDLALILGAYRVSMELAAPQYTSSLQFMGDERRIVCTAYSPAQPLPYAVRMVAEGNKIYWLSFAREANGMPNFESFRNMCDRFCALKEEGKVLLARPVAGDMTSVLQEMAVDRILLPGKDASLCTSDGCQGILFACRTGEDLPEIGVAGALLSSAEERS